MKRHRFCYALAMSDPSGRAATAIYARMSVDRDDEAQGVDRQLQDARELVARRGFGAAVEFVDNDISASKFSAKPRPAYRDMLRAVRAGEVSRIVVYHVDRLYRQPRELEELIDLAESRGVRVESVVSGELNLSNGDGVFAARILVNVAAKSSDDASRRIKRAKQQAREQGDYHGGHRAFGWNRDEPHPVEAPHVADAFERIAAGATMADIARDWNARVNGKDGEPRRWDIGVIRKIVSNPRHAGLVGHRASLPRDGRTYDRRSLDSAIIGPTAAGAAIVSRELWERVQARLKVRGVRHVGVPRRRTLLTGMLACGLCGATMVRAGGRSGSLAWRCPPPGLGKADGCGRVFISGARVEEWATEAVLQRADSVDWSEIVKSEAPTAEASALSDELGRLAQRDHELGAMFADGTLSSTAYATGHAAVEARRRETEADLGKLTTSAALRPFVGRPGALRTSWNRLDDAGRPVLTVDAKRAVLGLLLGRISVAPPVKRGSPRFDPNRLTLLGTLSV